MLVYRSVVVGLLGAACLLFATRSQRPLVLAAPAGAVVVVPPSEPAEPSAPPVTVIDVAPGVRGDTVASLIVLAANEHITAIDDRPVANAHLALASLELTPRAYVDVSIASDIGATRRVLVLAR